MARIETAEEPETSGPEPDIAAPGPDISGLELDISALAPDISPPVLDISALEPEIFGLAPEISPPVPDTSALEPEIFGLAPEISLPVPDISVPKPEISGLKLEISALEPDTSGVDNPAASDSGRVEVGAPHYGFPVPPSAPRNGLHTALRRPLTLLLQGLNRGNPSKCPGTARQPSGSRKEHRGDEPDHVPRSCARYDRHSSRGGIHSEGRKHY